MVTESPVVGVLGLTDCIQPASQHATPAQKTTVSSVALSACGQHAGSCIDEYIKWEAAVKSA